MVWHSYMLNPRKYLADAVRYDKWSLWTTNLPWLAIGASIDNKTFLYEPGERARRSFEARTGLAWVDLGNSLDMTQACPRCYREIRFVLTTCNHEKDWWTDQPNPPWEGFADKEFKARCSECDLVVDHEMLRALRFRKDIIALQQNDVPMAGTTLDAEGKQITQLSSLNPSAWVLY